MSHVPARAAQVKSPSSARPGAVTGAGQVLFDSREALTRHDILTELAFGNVTVLTQITGRQIPDAIENGVSRFEDGAVRFPQMSGLRVFWDPTAPAMVRVAGVTVDGAALDVAAACLVATTDFMLGGGDGCGALGGGRALIDQGNGSMLANDVMEDAADAALG